MLTFLYALVPNILLSLYFSLSSCRFGKDQRNSNPNQFGKSARRIFTETLTGLRVYGGRPMFRNSRVNVGSNLSFQKPPLLLGIFLRLCLETINAVDFYS